MIDRKEPTFKPVASEVTIKPSRSLERLMHDLSHPRLKQDDQGVHGKVNTSPFFGTKLAHRERP